MIKKSYLSMVFLTVFFMTGTLLFAQEEVAAPEDSLSSFQILGSASLGYAGNSNMDDVTKEMGKIDVDYYNALVPGSPFSADDSTANFTYGFDLDLRYFFGNVGLGAEIGYHAAGAKTEVKASGYVDNTTTTLDLTVIPVVASLYYRIPMYSQSFVLIGAGLGYYSATLNYKYKEDDTLPATNNAFETEGKQAAIGYHALIEYDLVMGGGFTLFTGLKARYVQFDKFEKSGQSLVSVIDASVIKGGLTGVNVYFGAGLSI